MADKSVNLTGTRVMASTIADFYNRLNALRSLNGGDTTVNFTVPAYGTLVQPNTIQEARDAVLATKSALTFLATIDISTYTPRVPSQGELIEASDTVHPIEWQIGQLENACFAYFGSNRLANRTANFNNFNLADTTNCPAYNATNKNPNYTTNFAAQYTGNFAAQYTGFFATNHTANYAAQYTGFFATNRTANYVAQYTGFWATNRTANYVAQYTGFWATNFTAQRASNNRAHWAVNKETVDTTGHIDRLSNCSYDKYYGWSCGVNDQNHFSNNWISGGVQHVWVQNFANRVVQDTHGICRVNYANNWACYYSPNFQPDRFSNYAPKYNTQYTANRGTNFTAQRVTNFTAQRSTNFTTQRVTNFTAQRATNYTTQRVTNFTAQRATNFTTQRVTNHTTQRVTNHTTQYASQFTSQCSVVYTAVKETNFITNNQADNTADFTAVTTSYYANHGTFTVSPLN